jgi:hypothetical protein
VRNLATLGLVMLCAAGLASAQVQFVDNWPGTFVDISTTGTALDLGDDSVTNVDWLVGNDLFPAGNVRISNNGAIGFLPIDAYGPCSPGNAQMPIFSLFDENPALAVFWDDIDSDHGNVYLEEMGDGTLIVQWHERPHFSGFGATEFCTFQVQVFPTGRPIYAQFLYQDVFFDNPDWDWGASATIGYQESENYALEYSFNQPVLENGDVLTLVPEPTSILGLVLIALLRRR